MAMDLELNPSNASTITLSQPMLSRIEQGRNI